MHLPLTNQERDILLSIQKTGYHDYYDYPLTIVDCEVTIEEAAWSRGWGTVLAIWAGLFESRLTLTRG